MSIDISVEVNGLDEVIRKMELTEAKINSVFTMEQLKEFAEIVRDTARDSAPFRTGLLKASLQIIIDEPNLSVTIGTDAGYGKFVELGTRKMQAKPFLIPAVFEALEEFKRRYPEKLSEEYSKS
jgi:HK97 gp10 family phage protein